MNSRVTVIAIILTFISLILLGISMLRGVSSKVQTSPDIAYLTQPINSFTGTVESFDKDSVTVTKEAQVTQGARTSATPLPSRRLTYRIRITDKTGFSRMVLPPDYAQKTGISLIKFRPSAVDLKKGQSITVLTGADLRFLTNHEFDADMIELPPIQKLLTGTVENLRENTLVIKPMLDEKKRSHAITLTGSTIFSKNTFTTIPQPQMRTEKITRESLQPGMTLLVYLEKDTATKPYTAAYIEYNEYVSSPASPTPPLQNLTLPVPTLNAPL